MSNFECKISDYMRWNDTELFQKNNDTIINFEYCDGILFFHSLYHKNVTILEILTNKYKQQKLTMDPDLIEYKQNKFRLKSYLNKFLDMIDIVSAECLIIIEGLYTPTPKLDFILIKYYLDQSELNIQWFDDISHINNADSEDINIVFSDLYELKNKHENNEIINKCLEILDSHYDDFYTFREIINLKLNYVNVKIPELNDFKFENILNILEKIESYPKNNNNIQTINDVINLIKKYLLKYKDIDINHIIDVIINKYLIILNDILFFIEPKTIFSALMQLSDEHFYYLADLIDECKLIYYGNNLNLLLDFGIYCLENNNLKSIILDILDEDDLNFLIEHDNNGLIKNYLDRNIVV